jgi:Domain of unknown function (DUF427)
MTLLARAHHETYCPYKGDASYFSIPVGGERSTNAVWTYDNPYHAVAAIKDYYVAFYFRSRRCNHRKAAQLMLGPALAQHVRRRFPATPMFVPALPAPSSASCCVGPGFP